jgi:hypothetical protein
MKKMMIALSAAAVFGLAGFSAPASAHTLSGATTVHHADADMSARRKHCHVRKVVKFRHGRKIVRTVRRCH